MPYIKQDERLIFDGDCEIMSANIETEGQLNYVITKLCHGYLKKHGTNYANLNAVHGVLNCADKELYRRITSPYEDTKIEQNGDVK